MARFALLAAFGIAAVFLGPALNAQENAAPAAPGQPAVTDMKNYEDWVTRCFKIQSPAPCDMSQIVLDPESKQRILQISIGYAPEKDTYVAQIVVPLGISLASGLALSAGDYRAANIQFSRCIRDGCYVEAQIEKEAIAAFSKSGNAIIIVIAWADSRVLDLPFSLKGFNDAHAAMVKLNRAKAAAAPAPAPSNP